MPTAGTMQSSIAKPRITCGQKSSPKPQSGVTHENIQSAMANIANPTAIT